MNDLKDKIAVVTGGTKGIGRAIVESLLGKGATVLFCGRKREDLEATLKELGNPDAANGFVCDMRDEAQVSEMIEACNEKLGGVDILINNAGVGGFATVEEIEPETFRQILETNLFGVFYACHRAIPLMRQRGGGYIINISSLAGTNAHPKMAAYNASKFGLNGFSEAMMQEVREHNIKVSYVMPGSVNTDFGGVAANPANTWALQSEDVAQVVIDLLEMPARALPSRVELRPSKPPKK